ncbi:MAG TPA: nuclear transport factor 2 family protein [Gemmatimonadaceae bacterium]|nr:nuclear transport factor 2 family protein [Gemmatimonadaceae bacterium]
MTVHHAHRELVDRYIAAYNAFDVAGMLAVLHPDITFENVQDGRVTVATSGMEEFRRLAEQAARLFSSRRQTIRGYAVRDDGAEVDIDYEGVLAADLGPSMRAGDTLRLAGRSRFRFLDGRIAHITDES